MIEGCLRIQLPDGAELRLAHLLCEGCKNEFFIYEMPENEPSCCPYCRQTVTHINEGNSSRRVDPGA